jgi:hypothetical protein
LKEFLMNFGWLEVYVRIGRNGAALRKYRVGSRERTRRVERQLAARLQREFDYTPAS